ncbi:MAG: HTH domain-containing protein [[Clostridium] innocuum]
MKDNISTLLDYLWHHYESWISAAELSQLLHVSTRQIRKYISILNEEHVEEPLVISTNKGYKLSSTEQYLRYRESGKHNLETPQTRQNLIIQKLISSKNGIDIFDLAQELYVSESPWITISAVFAKCYPPIRSVFARKGCAVYRRQ